MLFQKSIRRVLPYHCHKNRCTKCDDVYSNKLKNDFLTVRRGDKDGQFRIIYYSRIVKPNPNPFLAINTINIKAFITSLQQKHNQKTSLLQCNQIMSARVCIMRKRMHSINVCVCVCVSF